MRVFVDANVLFSAAYGPGSITDTLIRSGAGVGVQFISCAYVLDEARRNLTKKVPHRLDRLAGLSAYCQMAPTITQGPVPAGLPAKDQPVWLSALAAGCGILLTGDKKDFGRLNSPELRVMEPRALMTQYYL